MSEWVTKPLGELALLEIGGTPSRSQPNFWADESAEGHPWVSISDMHGRRIRETRERITDIGVRCSNVKAVKAGTVLMSFKLTIGEITIADRDLYTNEAIVAISPKNSTIQSDFLFLTLPDLAKSTVASAVIKGATLNKEKLWKIPIFFPKSTFEQSRITSIIGSLDHQIEQTEALIAKQEKIRAGLMHDLFTRGIDDTGALRPPREVAPELYHETELGWLPRGWSAPQLDSLLAPVGTPMRSGPFGSALLKSELVKTGVPLLGIDNIHIEKFISEFSRFVPRRKFGELARYRVLSQDVVITIMGTVGRCCVIPHGLGEMLSSKHLWTMTFDQTKVSPLLVCWQLNHAPWVKAWFRQQAQGGIMDAIQSSTLKTLRLPNPQVREQKLLEQIYQSTSAPLRELRDEVDKMASLRSGLMQDLLTGKVSVEPLLRKQAA